MARRALRDIRRLDRFRAANRLSPPAYKQPSSLLTVLERDATTVIASP